MNFAGQRDKPFVSDEDMRSRTPRPDVLSVPPNNNYYDGLREAETKVKCKKWIRNLLMLVIKAKCFHKFYLVSVLYTSR